MAVIAKKEEKVKSIFDSIGIECTIDEFKNKFIEMYPKEWEKVGKAYNSHERHNSKEKGHPMPEPDTYIKNAYNVGKKKYQEKKIR